MRLTRRQAGGGCRGERHNSSDGLGDTMIGSASFSFFIFYLINRDGQQTAMINRSFIVTLCPRRLSKMPRLSIFSCLSKGFL